MVAEQLLRQRLVACQQQAARVTAGVGQAHHLEKAHQVIIEGAVAGEILDEVEGDVRLPFLDGLADRRKIVVDADDAQLVAELEQRLLDVVLCAVLFDARILGAGEIIGGTSVGCTSIMTRKLGGRECWEVGLVIMSGAIFRSASSP